MGKHRSSPSGRKNPMRKQGMEKLCTIARPPQECWSIRERINFRIALTRYVVLLKHEPDIQQTIPTSSAFLTEATNLHDCTIIHSIYSNSKPISFRRFGQDWPRVAQFIATKTTDQVRMPPAKLTACLLIW
jgi:hypothetical protein